jgi:hypothetical protein
MPVDTFDKLPTFGFLQKKNLYNFISFHRRFAKYIIAFAKGGLLKDCVKFPPLWESDEGIQISGPYNIK